MAQEEEYEINYGAQVGDVQRVLVLAATCRIDAHVIALKVAFPHRSRAPHGMASYRNPASEHVLITHHLPNHEWFTHSHGTFASDLPDQA